MGDFIGQLRARQAQINAEIGQHLSAIAALSNKMSDIAAAGRVFAGIVSTKESTAARKDVQRPSEDGISTAGTQAPPVDEIADTSGTMSDVSAAMTSLLGEADAASEEVGGGPAAAAPHNAEVAGGSDPDNSGAIERRISEGSPQGDAEDAGVMAGETAPKSHATDKSGAASSEAAPAPSLRQRIAELHAAHPELTPDEAMALLGCKRGSLTGYSSTLGIKWAGASTRPDASGPLSERVRDTHYKHRDWSDDQIAAHLGCGSSYVRTVAQRLGLTLASRRSPQKAVEPAPAPDEPSPVPEPETPPAVKSEPAIDAPRIPRPLSGSKFHLVNDKGEYLNRFCAGFTTDRRTAWIGTEQQLAACRRNFEIARDLTERPVGKELPPVPVNREVA